MKNGVITSIVLSVVLTLTLAITTIATAFGGGQVTTPSVYLAYRTGDVCEELNNYKKVDLGYDVTTATAAIVYNSETGVYEAKNATESTINGSAVDKAGRTYDLHIDVFAQGTGASADSPWVIANANHVNEFSSLINDDDDSNNPAFAEVKANIDMANKSGAFRPIGTIQHAYTGKIEGNNKTISNLSISVNAANYEDYAVEDNYSKKHLLLGLFGYVAECEIKNVGLSNEKITISEDLCAAIDADADGLNMRRVAVGGVAAVATASSKIVSTTNTQVSNTINAFSYTKAGDLAYHGVGGVVGYLNANSEVSGLVVNTKITANKPVIEKAPANEQSFVGGIVGYAKNCAKIENLNVTLTAKTTYNNCARIGGVAGYLNSSHILSTTVAGVGISGNETFRQIANTYANEDAADKITMIGGVVSFIDSNSSVEDVVVNNASIDVKAKVGGVAFGNEGIIEDAKVNGTLIGFSVGGVAFENDGTIRYTSEFSGKTVNGTLKGVYVGGLVASNLGTIDGKISGTDYAEVDVYVKSVSGVVEGGEAALMAATKTAYVAGLAAFNANEITNFKVNATVADGLNMAGLVGVMGKCDVADTTARTAVLSNITAANIEIISNNSTSTSTTYSIGGAVNNVYAGSTIDNVNIAIAVNQSRISTHKYGAAFVGGLVARIYENGVTITNNTVSGSVYTNFTNYSQVVGETKYDQMNLGGFIGTIAGYTDDSHSITQIDVNEISVYGNTLENFELRCEAELENIPVGLRAFRNIATFVGLIYNTNTVVSGKSWAITFTNDTLDEANNNVMNNVQAYAYNTTFTAAGGESRHGDAGYDGSTINGIDLTTGKVVNVADACRTNVSYIAL